MRLNRGTVLAPRFNNHVFRGPDPTKVVLSDAEIYLTFLLEAPEYSPFPHTRRPIFAFSFGINNRGMAWNLVATQIRNNVMDKNWTHAQSLAKIADIFARTFAAMRNCRFPLYISKEEAEEWFDIWRLINEQQPERYEW